MDAASDEMPDRNTLKLLIEIAKLAYGNGHVGMPLHFDEREELRRKAAKALKALGLKK